MTLRAPARSSSICSACPPRLTAPPSSGPESPQPAAADPINTTPIFADTLVLKMNMRFLSAPWKDAMLASVPTRIATTLVLPVNQPLFDGPAQSYHLRRSSPRVDTESDRSYGNI